MATRFGLPDINFVDTDVAEYENIAVREFEAIIGETLSESDPRRKFIQANIFLMTMIANNIDYTGKQNTLSYAVDDYLDHLGAKKNTPRLEPVSATTIVRFNINNPEPFTIPAGTRMMINEQYFATTSPTFVEVGPSFIDIELAAEEAGTQGNGYLPGQISNIVDPDQLPWVSSASNITVSSGGIDWEDDDSYADRIRNANEGFATTGPELAYEFYAKSSNQNIIDVNVDSPAPSEVEITILMKNGEIPSEEEKLHVLEVCSARDVRPLTDFVKVASPKVVNYDLKIVYYLPQSSFNYQSEIVKNIEKSKDEYILWQKSRLGRGIDPSELYGKLQIAGARRISVEPNTYIPLADNEVAKDGNITLTFGGFIND